MADFEVLAPGGHQHLVDKIKEQLDLKADAAMADAVDKVARNQVTREVEGKLVSVEDAYGAPMLSLGVDGKSTQASTTGKNLLDESNNIVRGYFYANTSEIKNGGTAVYAPVAENTTYTVSGGNGNRRAMAFTESLPQVGTALFGGVNLPNNYSAQTLTAPAGAKYVVFYIDISSTLTPQGYQLEAGSTATAYEPYTGGKPSPNPDYPQPIESVDELAVTFAGRNMVKDSDREYSLTTSQYAGYDIAYMLADATQFTISVDAVVPSGQTLYLYGYDGVNNYAFGTMRLQGNGRYAHTVNIAAYVNQLKNIKNLRVYSQPYTGGTSVVTKISNCTLVVGTDTEYIPSDIKTVPIPLQDHVLRSLPDGTKDTLALTYLRPSTREGWAWYSRELVQRVGYIADMVNLIWTHTTNRARSNSLANVIAIPARNVVPSILAEKYVPKEYGAFVAGHPEYIQVTDAGELYSLYLDDIGTPTGELDYLLATPVTTTLDPIELPVLPAPNATVWADPTTGLTIEYVRDTEIVIDSLYAEIDRAHAAIAPVEHGTSSANYAVGSYLMLDGTFCKVTSAIATGETIAIGTNVVATTVDAELASLA